MSDLAYSKKVHKRIIFVFICMLMSFLLSVSMFPKEAVASITDNIITANSQNADTLYKEDDNSSFQESDVQETNLQEKTNLPDSQIVSSENAENKSDNSSQQNATNNAVLQESSNDQDDANYSSIKDANAADRQTDIVNSDSLDAVSASEKELEDSKLLDVDDLDKYKNTNEFIGDGPLKTGSYVGNDDNWKHVSSVDGDPNHNWWDSNIEEVKAKDEGGSGTANDPYLVSTASTFLKLLRAGDIEKDAPQKYAHIKLLANIDLTDYKLIDKVETDEYFKLFPYSTFSGTIYGENHKITCSTNSRTPLFYKLVDATFNDVVFSYNVRYLERENEASASLDRLGNHLGLLSSEAEGNITINNCKFYGSVQNRADDAGYRSKYIGGIIGKLGGSKTTKAIFTNVKNYAEISANGTARHWTGGFIGGTTDEATVSFDGCENNGSVSTMSATSLIANLFISFGIMIANIIGTTVFYSLISGAYFTPGTAMTDEQLQVSKENLKNTPALLSNNDKEVAKKCVETLANDNHPQNQLIRDYAGTKGEQQFQEKFVNENWDKLCRENYDISQMTPKQQDVIKSCFKTEVKNFFIKDSEVAHFGNGPYSTETITMSIPSNNLGATTGWRPKNNIMILIDPEKPMFRDAGFTFKVDDKGCSLLLIEFDKLNPVSYDTGDFITSTINKLGDNTLLTGKYIPEIGNQLVSQDGVPVSGLYKDESNNLYFLTPEQHAKATINKGTFSINKFTNVLKDTFNEVAFPWSKSQFNSATAIFPKFFHTNNSAFNVISRVFYAISFLSNKSYSKMNPLETIVRNIKSQSIINENNQKIGKQKFNNIVKDAITDSLRQMQEYSNNSSDAENIFGKDLYEYIKSMDLGSDVNEENNAIYAILNQAVGDLFKKRFNSLTGASEYLYNITNYDPNSNDKEIKNLENNDDFLAAQGKYLYENWTNNAVQPVASVLTDDEYKAFLNSDKANKAFNSVRDLVERSNVSRNVIYNAYKDLGKVFFERCAQGSNNNSIKNKAYDQDTEFSLNALLILKNVTFDLYCKERNMEETYSNISAKDMPPTVTTHGSAMIRKFMNLDFKDNLEWTEFVNYWMSHLYPVFEDNMLKSNLWAGSLSDLSHSDKVYLIKQFFITYLTYTGEFSFSNYLPFTRSTIMIKNSNLYAIDFRFSDEYASDYEQLKSYIPTGEKWKYTYNSVEYEKPLQRDVLFENYLISNKDSIDEMLNHEYSESDFTNTDVGVAVNNDNHSSFSGNLYECFENLSAELQKSATSLPKGIPSKFESQYKAAAGGFIGLCEDTIITANDSHNNATVSGGDYAGGLFGLIDGSAKVEINNSCNYGSVSVSDVSHWNPTAGGLIGCTDSSKVNVSIKSTLSSGAVISRRTAGGFVGTAHGTYYIENCGCMAGIAAPTYCGGYIGIAEHLNSIDIVNSYSASVYDAVSNVETVVDQPNLILNLIGFSFPSFAVNYRNKTFSNKPGAFFGDYPRNNSFKNCFYKQGEDIIGNDKNDMLSDSIKNQINPVSIYELSNGSVTYKLNTYYEEYMQDSSKTSKLELPFGQIIDNFTLGNKNNIPIPCSKAKVYLNVKSSTSPYTNFDPQYINFKTVTLNCKNASTNLYVDSLNVPNNEALPFIVKADEAYQIDKVWYEYLSPDGTSVIKKDLTRKSGTIYKGEYRIDKIDVDMTIYIETVEKNLKAPRGTGSDLDPYLIGSADELAWLNKTLNNAMYTSANIKLTSDIDFVGYKWIPVGSKQEGMGFNGCFDGAGHKIYNISIDDSGRESGAFFNAVEGGTENGVFVSKVDNTKSVDEILKENDSKIAVPSDSYNLITYLRNRFSWIDKIDNKIVLCDKDNNSSAEETCLNKLRDDEHIKLCFANFKNIPADIDYQVFKIRDDAIERGVVKNLTLIGNFKDAVFANSARNARLENCVSEGTVSASGVSCGGIVAYASKNIQIYNCTNKAEIVYSAPDVANPSCGGIVGSLTSMKYVFNNATIDQKINTDYKGSNYLDAEIKNCKNQGYMSVSKNNKEYTDTPATVGGIVGSVFETNTYASYVDGPHSDSKIISYKKSNSNTDYAYCLDAAYVLVDGCQNTANIGDDNNTYNVQAAGIVGSLGYLCSKQFYKCDVNNCINWGKIGSTSSDAETGMLNCAGIVAFSENNATKEDLDNKTKYNVDTKVFRPITANLSEIWSTPNVIANCANYGNFRARSKGVAAQICPDIGRSGIIADNCIGTNLISDLFSNIDCDSTQFITNNLYFPKNGKKLDNLYNFTRKEFEQKDLDSGEITYKLNHPDKILIPYLKPHFGQNIDVLEKGGKKLERQFMPCLFDDDTQLVYKRGNKDYYSAFASGSAEYTNVEGSESSFKSDNSYKVNININSDENESSDQKQLSKGTIDGYTTVKKQDNGNARFEYEINGTNGNTIKSIKFGNVDVVVQPKSNKYILDIEKRSDGYYYNSKMLKHYVTDEYVTFDLDVEFINVQKPNFVDGKYIINNLYELRWYAQNFDNKEECSKDAVSKNGVWDALLNSTITIEDDSYFEPIGTEDHKYTGSFTGPNFSTNATRKIINNTSKPIFGVVGDNAYISNLGIETNYEGDSKWSASLANIVKGKNVIIDHVVVSGNVSEKTLVDYSVNNDSAGSFVSKLDGKDNNSSLKISNCVNSLNITKSSKNIAGFVGVSDCAKLYIQDSTNAGNITNTTSNSCNNAGVVGLIYDDISNFYEGDNDDNSFVKKHTNISMFKVNNKGKVSHSIKTGTDGEYIGGNAGVIGLYKAVGDIDNLSDISANVDLVMCNNYNDISGHINTAGIVGEFTYDGQGLYENQSPSNINIIACENFATIENDGRLFAGGIVAQIDGKFITNLDKCIVDAALINNQHQNNVNQTGIGGLIGYVKTWYKYKGNEGETRYSTNITNCSVYVSNIYDLLAKNYSFFGAIIRFYEYYTWEGADYSNINLDNTYYLAYPRTLDNYHKGIIKKSYFYTPDYLERYKYVDKPIMVGNSRDFNPSGLHSINAAEYTTGVVAYNINKGIKDNDVDNGKIVLPDGSSINCPIGQVIDDKGNPTEKSPRINSPLVCKAIEAGDKDIYSNYGKESKDKYIVQVHANKDSFDKCSDSNYVFEKSSKNLNISLYSDNKSYTLDKLIINNVTFNKNGNDDNNISLYDLRNDYSDELTSPFEDEYTLNLYKLNKLVDAKCKKQILNDGFNYIEYSFTDNVEPQKIEYDFYGHKEEAFAITNAKELIWFFDTNNSLFKEQDYSKDNPDRKFKNAILKNDIDMSGYNWSQYDYGLRFEGGRLYGFNHKILNLSGECSAFLVEARNAEFRDFELNVAFTFEHVNSAFISQATDTVYMENINVTGYVAASDCLTSKWTDKKGTVEVEYFGGLVGESRGNGYRSDDGCVLKYMTEPKGELSECIAFATNRGNTIVNCKNNLRSLTFNKELGKYAEIGGVVARVAAGSNIAIYSCTNNVDLSFSKYYYNAWRPTTGGILGYIMPSWVNVSIYNCKNLQRIESRYAGGIVGLFGQEDRLDNEAVISNKGELNIKNCTNEGNISGMKIGGVLGAADYVGTTHDTEFTSINIEACMNKANIVCYKSKESIDPTADDNVAGGIIGWIADNGGHGSSKSSRTIINHSANVGEVTSNYYSPAGGIVGSETKCKNLVIQNSYSVDNVNSKNEFQNGVIGFVEDKDEVSCVNCAVVGSRNLNISNVDSNFNDNYRFGYESMIDGSLVYCLNLHNVQKSYGYQQSHESYLEYSKSPVSFGQILDNYHNKDKCSTLYPEANKFDIAPVYSMGNAWKWNASDVNDGKSLNFCDYNNTTLVSNCWSSESANKHKELYSNYKDSVAGVQVNVWNYGFDGETLRSTGNNYTGSALLVNANGSINNIESINDGYSRALSNSSKYYSIRKSSSDITDNYNFIFHPQDGYTLSWIAIDGEYYDANKFNFSSNASRNRKHYNMLSTSELFSVKDNGALNSHTIDVGFSATQKPDFIDNKWNINNYSQLLWFSDYINKGGKDLDAVLCNDIEATHSSQGAGWTPIGTLNNPYKGHFYGNNHYIRGLFKKVDDHVAFIKYGIGCQVQDLNLKNVDFESTGEHDGDNGEVETCAALIAYAANIKISNVNVDGKLTSSGERTGGIVGYLNRGISNEIRFCESNLLLNDAPARKAHMGGIVGWIDYGTQTIIDNCVNRSNIHSNTYSFGASDYTTDYAGGIVGYAECHDKTILNICNCANLGTILGDSAGGIIADFEDSRSGRSNEGASLKIQSCMNYGAVVGDYCGGILGRIDNASVNSDWYTIDWCSNYGSIGTPNYKIRTAGGIVGQLWDGDIKINMNYCNNTGIVFAGGGYSPQFDTGISTLNTLITTPGMVTFLAGGISALSNPFGPVILAAAIVGSVTFCVETVINFVVKQRSTVTCRSGGIIGHDRNSDKINIANTINFGITSALDESNGICTNINDSFKNLTNVYSINPYTNSDTFNINKSDFEKKNINYCDFNSFANGEISYLIQNSKKAGMRYFGDKEVVSDKNDINKVNKVLYNVSPDTSKSNVQTYYFGQNIDTYYEPGEKDFNLQISKIPIYNYDNKIYRIYKYPDDFANDNSIDRSYYTNHKDIKEISKMGFGKISIQGNDKDFEDIDKNTENFNEDNQNNVHTQSFSSFENTAFASDNVDNQVSNLGDSDNSEDNDFIQADNDKKKEESKDDEDFNKYFDVIVRGNKSLGEVKPSISSNFSLDNLNISFNMFDGEDVDIEIKPKNSSIYKIDNVSPSKLFSEDAGFMQLSQSGTWEKTQTLNSETNTFIRKDNGWVTTYLENGSILYRLNPRYIVNKSTNAESYYYSDFNVEYTIEGGAKIHIDKAITKDVDNVLKVTISKRNNHIHKVPDTNKDQVFLPYSGTSDLPDIPGAYYLQNDIELNKNWVVPSGKTYLCTNGHQIKLGNNAMIDLESNNAQLCICDCNKDDTKWKVEEKNGNFEITSVSNNKDAQLTGSIIYKEANAALSDYNNAMFVLGKSSVLNIDKASILLSNNCKTAVYVDDDGTSYNYNLVLNSKFYETSNADTDKSHSLVTINNSVYSQLENIRSNIVIGNLFEHLKIDGSKLYDDNFKTNIADFYLLNKNASINVNFVDNYKFDHPLFFNINNQNDYKDTCVNLTKDFDKYISRGIIFTDVFKSLDDNNIAALTSLEDLQIKLMDEFKNNNFESNTKTYYNNVCICDKDSVFELKLNVEGNGDIYPKIAHDKANSEYGINYKKASNAKFYYQADEFSYMNFARFYKTNINEFISVDKQIVPANSKLWNEEKSDYKIGSKGTFVVSNISALQENIPYFTEQKANAGDGYNKIKVLSDQEIEVESSVNFVFVNTQDSDVDVTSAILWNDNSSLPDENTIVSDGNKHVVNLMTDVALKTTYYVPSNVKLTINLNGHSISPSTTEAGMSNKNLIVIDDPNTSLNIVDKPVQTNDTFEKSFKLNEDGTKYEQVDNSQKGSKDTVTVSGGLIYGASVSRSSIENDDCAGAIVVNRGVLNLLSGAVAFNSSSDILGGSGITVNKNGHAYIFNDAKVAYNVCNGIGNYYKHNFAGGVASEGSLYNYGSISNNIGGSYSASAVCITDGKFTNNGQILDNVANDNKSDEQFARQITGAVYISSSAVFNNAGKIANNIAKYETAAVVTNGKMSIKGNSSIVLNKWTTKTEKATQEDYQVLDIDNLSYSPIEITNKLNIFENNASVINYKPAYNIVTSGWLKYCGGKNGKLISQIFSLPTSDNDNKNIVLALNEDFEVTYISKYDACKIDLWYKLNTSDQRQNQLADCNLLDNEVYVCEKNININIEPKQNYELSEVNIDGKSVQLQKEHVGQFSYYFRTWSDTYTDKSDYKVITVEIILKKVTKQLNNNNALDTDSNTDTISQENKSNSNSPINWGDNDDQTTSLPEEEGEYKLTSDINLDETCIVKNNIKIDLAGYSIRIKNENQNIFYLDDSSSKLTIKDSSIVPVYDDSGKNIISYTSQFVHYLVKNNDGSYMLSDIETEDSIKIYGGLIGNASYSNCENSGAIYAERGVVTLEAGNIVANKVLNKNPDNTSGKGSSAIYIGSEASLNMSEKVNISYNYARCEYSDNNDDRYQYGAAALEIRGKGISSATISHNVSDKNSVAGVAVVSKNSSFDNFGKISNNTAYDHSVAAMLLIADVNVPDKESDMIIAKNYGEISNNTASNCSIAAVELYGVLTNSGSIEKNVSLDDTSYAGVYVCGSLILDGIDGAGSSLSQNWNKKTNAYQDVVFYEEDYSPYAVQEDGETPKKALFTLGPNFNPSVGLKYKNSENDSFKPKSLTYISVRADESFDKTLLLAKGYTNDVRSMQNVNEYFASVEDNYSVTASIDKNLYYHPTNKTSTLTITQNNGGSVSSLGVTKTPIELKMPIDVAVLPDNGYEIEKISATSSDGEVSDPQITNKKDFNFTIQNNKAWTNVNVSFKKQDIGGSVVQNNSTEVEYQDWVADTFLPASEGFYKLTRDVVLQSTWYVPIASLTIDFNGHCIKLADNKQGSVFKLEKGANLSLIDSNKERTTPYDWDVKTGKFVCLSKNNRYSANGGYIMGGNAVTASNNCGGGICVEKGAALNVNGPSIVGNNAEIGGAIYNDGIVFVGENTTIAGNTAKIAAGIYNATDAKLLLGGNLCYNCATDIAGGLYNNGLIQLNQGTSVIDKAVPENGTSIYNNVSKYVYDSKTNKVSSINDDIVFQEYNAQSNNKTAIEILKDLNNNGKFIYLSLLLSTDINDPNRELHKMIYNYDAQKMDNGMYVLDRSGFWKAAHDNKGSYNIIDKVIYRRWKESQDNIYAPNDNSVIGR